MVSVSSSLCVAMKVGFRLAMRQQALGASSHLRFAFLFLICAIWSAGVHLFVIHTLTDVRSVDKKPIKRLDGGPRPLIYRSCKKYTFKM